MVRLFPPGHVAVMEPPQVRAVRTEPLNGVAVGMGEVEGGEWLIIWGEKTKRDDRGVSNPKGSCTPLKASRFLLSLVFFFCCHFFIVVKHTYHEVYYFNHFPLCNSVALSTFTMLCNHSYTTVHSLSQAAYTPNVSWPQMEGLPSLSSTSRPSHPPSPGLQCSSCSQTRFPTASSTLSLRPQHSLLTLSTHTYRCDNGK